MTENAPNRFVRVGFVVAKLRAGPESFFLLRYNPRWQDLNLIGGHEDPRDGGSLERTARRELREEVPLIRMYDDYHLEKISDPISYGPIFSKSRNVMSIYEAHFYLLLIDSSPAPLVHRLTARSKNVWVEQEEIIRHREIRISHYIRLLSDSIIGGLRAIPYSSTTNLISIRNHFDGLSGSQPRFHF